MVRRVRAIALLSAAVVLFAGCESGPPIQGTSGRWVSYSGSFDLRPSGVIAVSKGCLAAKGLRWNGNRVSFQVYDDPATTWAVYFFDENFAAVRSKSLPNLRNLLKQADRSFRPWTASIMISLLPLHKPDSAQSTLFARSVVTMAPSAITGTVEDFRLTDKLVPRQWNKIVVDFSNGFGRSFINDQPGGEFRYDHRVDGGIGFDIAGGEQMLVKDFAVGPIPVEKPGP